MIRINLLADRQAKDRMIIQQQLVLGVIILLATVALCGFWWQIKSAQISDTNKKIVSAKQELERQKKIRAEVAKMEAREKRVKAILAAIDSLKEIKRGPTIYFDNLNVILPPEIWLTEVRDSSGAISIKGYSFSNNAIAQLMRNLEKSEHFGLVELSEIQKTTFATETLKDFTVTCMTTLGQKLLEEKQKREAAAKQAAKKAKKR